MVYNRPGTPLTPGLIIFMIPNSDDEVVTLREFEELQGRYDELVDFIDESIELYRFNPDGNHIQTIIAYFDKRVKEGRI